MSTSPPKLSFASVRGFIVDGVLIAAAVSFATGVVQDWLIAHEIALVWILGAVHLTMLPLLTLAQLINGAPGAQLVIGPKSSSPVAKAFIGSYVLFFGTSFIVPAVLPLGAPSVSISLGAMLTVIFAPYVLMAASAFIAVGYDKKTGYRHSRIDAPPPRNFTRVLVAMCGLYLLCAEAMMLVVASQHAEYSLLAAVAAAFVGYLPARLCIALAQETAGWELVSLVVAFGHFLYRLAAA